MVNRRKTFPLAYKSQITTTFGLSPYKKVFNQKPRKPIRFTVNSSKNAQVFCQPTKDSICYNLPLHTYDEDRFHRRQISKLAPGSHTESVSSRDKKMKTVRKMQGNYNKDKTSNLKQIHAFRQHQTLK